MPCGSYFGLPHDEENGIVLSQASKSKLYYFAVQNNDGKTLFRSEGYPTPEVREIGIRSVQENRPFAKNYRVIEQNGSFYVILIAENDQEIARSCPFHSRAEINSLFPNVDKKQGDSFPKTLIPKWLWGALPLLFIGGYFIGKWCNKPETIIVKECYLQEDELSQFEMNFQPITLYFDNAIPKKDTVIPPYDQLVKNYKNREAKFERKLPKDEHEIDDFFADIKHGNESLYKLTDSINKILQEAKNDKNIDSIIYFVDSYASPLGTPADNMELTKRRIKSIDAYFEKNVVIKNKVKIKAAVSVPHGSNDAVHTIPDKPNDLKAIYSVAASKERRLEITKIRVFGGKYKKGMLHLIKCDSSLTKKADK